MASFFSRLRRTNKVYPSTDSFLIDHNLLINNQTPSGFNLNTPSTLSMSNGNVIPGYNINGVFVSNSNVNAVLRNNDVVGMRSLFTGVNNSQINGLTNLRRADNIPDATIHGLQTRKTNIKQAHPELMVRDRTGVENALTQNPRLGDYLRGAGAITLVGVGVYLIVNVADLVGSIVDALNRTGGSWYFRGNNGADNFANIQGCVLQYRTCGLPLSDIQDFVCVLDPLDPTNVDPLMSFETARNFCNNYNIEVEKSVCRGSDTTADPESLQYVDISLLDPNQTIQCIEPYDFGDLVADLGLDWLLGDEGIITSSSNSLTSVSDNIVTILLIVGGLVLFVFVGYIVFKIVTRNNK
ncbi:ODV-E56 [Erinnyis ello granulovirus]|uniref:ODV-E56 n=1 Tax=Erinnyis ello granulovirus TaxID=307444 RepID=A0A097DAH0_9BBAC|nr:ODV-E56 [Erinnyis ello granulovirus]AIS92016.1 ODV-E56 [Erinnyis ello granulovirus]ARX71355.1 odv-e56 [Erinnyis ello granulovirus]ARX71485.1 odv-e56 [Erinnyis ello granulovirus]ARX71615.1 odv-e56 [Erinnyis ello granulovirus]ARX71745.1 odv-e56 [Erinnyis ello granulovirus]